MISNKQKANKFQARIEPGSSISISILIATEIRWREKKYLSNYRKPLSAFNFAASPINCPLFPWIGTWHRGDNKYNTNYKVQNSYTMNDEYWILYLQWCNNIKKTNGCVADQVAGTVAVVSVVKQMKLSNNYKIDHFSKWLQQVFNIYTYIIWI